MADRSNGDEQHQIGLLGGASFDQPLRGFGLHPSDRVDAAHECVGLVGEPTDHAVGRHLSEPVEGEDAIGVVTSVGLVVGEVRGS